MHIWLAPSAFAPHRGGVEELSLKMAQHLQGAGHEVMVVTNRHPVDLPATDHVEGVPVLRLAFAPGGRRPSSVLRYLRERPALLRVLDESRPRPDLLHIICASAQLDPLAHWARRRAVPLMITTQGETEMDASQLFERSPWMRYVLRRRSGQAAALSACSSWTADRTAAVAPAFATAEVILNGVDPDDWGATPVPDEPVVCAWGRHVPQKGFDLLLPAFVLVRDARPHARLLLGGSGPDTTRLAEMAGAGVELLGPLDRSGVRDLLARSRVAVVPSRVEPFGIVAVEALASGRSLVYSNNGGLAEAAGGLGRGVDPGNSRALAAAIVEALDQAPAPEAGRQRAQELSWSRIMQQYTAVYDRILSAAP